MGRTVLVALVGVWLFNLARLVAAGLPGHAPDAGIAAAPVPAVAAGAQLEAPAPRLPSGAAIAIRAAQMPGEARSNISVAVMLAEPAIVDVDLYDATGHRVFTQTSARLPAGRSHIELHSTERLDPGDYWIRARAGDEVATASVEIHG